jgi:hypothetical protein
MSRSLPAQDLTAEQPVPETSRNVQMRRVPLLILQVQSYVGWQVKRLCCCHGHCFEFYFK